MADSKPVSCFRTNRFFRVSGGWYFTTREGADFGPFQSREEAEGKLSRYLDTQSIIHYFRGADREKTGMGESTERLVARMSLALYERDDVDQGTAALA